MNLRAQEDETRFKRGLKRGLIAGVWGIVLMAAGWRIMYDNLALLLIGLPALGLPWLMFRLNDQRDEDLKMDAFVGVMTLFTGGFLTMMCALPIAVVVAIVRAMLGL